MSTRSSSFRIFESIGGSGLDMARKHKKTFSRIRIQNVSSPSIKSAGTLPGGKLCRKVHHSLLSIPLSSERRLWVLQIHNFSSLEAEKTRVGLGRFSLRRIHQ
jgi:hypothetical protein